MAAPKQPATRFPFSKTRLESLAPPPSGRAYVYDSQTPGLQLCVTTAGTRSYYLYKRVGGRPSRVRLGGFPEMTVEQARRKAKRLSGAIADGVDPQAARRALRGAPTLNGLFDLWLSHAKQRKRTWRDDERQYEKYLGAFHNRKLEEITGADVATWHAKIGKDHGPVMANRARALLSAMFGVAHEIGHVGPNPCANVRRFKENQRERFLRPDEMRPFFAAVAAEPDPWCDFWLLCLFSGARRGNVASMTWGDLDLDAGLWHLPGAKAKSGLPLVIVLPEPAVEILRARRLAADKGVPWVFPADTATGHVVDPRKSWARVLKSSGLENLRPHDLRRTMGSWQASLGASLQIIGASLGHSDPKATTIYSRLQVDPVRKSVVGAVDAMLTAGGVKRLEDGGRADG